MPGMCEKYHNGLHYRGSLEKALIAHNWRYRTPKCLAFTCFCTLGTFAHVSLPCFSMQSQFTPFFPTDLEPPLEAQKDEQNVSKEIASLVQISEVFQDAQMCVDSERICSRSGCSEELQWYKHKDCSLGFSISSCYC